MDPRVKPEDDGGEGAVFPAINTMACGKAREYLFAALSRPLLLAPSGLLLSNVILGLDPRIHATHASFGLEETVIPERFNKV